MVQAKARRRIALAEALEVMPVRHPGEVLLAATRYSDVIQELTVMELKEGDTLTVEQIDRLKEAISTAQRMASAVFTAKADAALALKAQVDGEAVARVLLGAIHDVGLDEETARRLRQALGARLRAEDGSDSGRPRALEGRVQKIPRS